MSDNHNLLFVFTDDENTKNELINLNYPFIKKTGNFFIFRNNFNDKVLFQKLENSKLDTSKVLFTNKMFF